MYVQTQYKNCQRFLPIQSSEYKREQQMSLKCPFKRILIVVSASRVIFSQREIFVDHYFSTLGVVQPPTHNAFRGLISWVFKEKFCPIIIHPLTILQAANESITICRRKSYTARKIPFMYSFSGNCATPQSRFPQSCVCERFIYSQDQSTYFPAAE